MANPQHGLGKQTGERLQNTSALRNNHYTRRPYSHTLQLIEATQEGLQNDKINIKHPTIIPNIILPKHKRPKHHKTDIIRAIGYIINSKGALVADPTYKGGRCL
jgi:hypothetical protein